MFLVSIVVRKGYWRIIVQKDMVIHMKIAICDDERMVRELLTEKIRKYYFNRNKDVDIIHFKNGEILLKYEKLFEIDLLFLDVDMPGKNGLEIAREIRNHRNEKLLIVFLTAYREFVFESFKVDAFRYLVKPLRIQELREVLESIEQKSHEPEAYLSFTFQNEMYSIKYEDIIYMEGMRDKVWIYCKNHTYRWRGRMKNLNEMLQNKGFFQIHQSYIINMHKIWKYSSKSVLLDGNYEVPISRYRFDKFKEEYIKFWSNML